MNNRVSDGRINVSIEMTELFILSGLENIFPYTHYSSPLNFHRFCLVQIDHVTQKLIIRAETSSAHGARPRKIPGWVVVIRENFSVNKQGL